MTTDLRQKLLQVVSNFVVSARRDVKAEDVTEERTFVSLGMDSLDMVELSMELEDDFGIDLRGVEIYWPTVKDALDCVMSIKTQSENV